MKINGNDFDTVSIDCCNLNGLVRYIYPTPIMFYYCPICGARLDEYVYAVQVSETECIRINGMACRHCDALFSPFPGAFRSIERMRTDKKAYVLRKDYVIQYDKTQFNSIFENTVSACSQYVLCNKNELLTYTIVYETNDVSEENGIIHISSQIANELILAKRNNQQFVTINGNKYAIVKIRKKKGEMCKRRDADYKINKRCSYEELPEISSRETLHLYKGNVACMKKHHTVEFKARMDLLKSDPMLFYVEYCYECGKFLMRYDYYENYLKRYCFFPMKIEKSYDEAEGWFDDSYMAKESLLWLNGYTVDSNINYSSYKRQQILSQIMDYGIISKKEVLSHLQFLIDLNRRRRDRKDAVEKWLTDRNYVLEYKQSERPLVVIGKIVQRKMKTANGRGNMGV